jgi:hypothetical protein
MIGRGKWAGFLLFVRGEYAGHGGKVEKNMADFAAKWIKF